MPFPEELAAPAAQPLARPPSKSKLITKMPGPLSLEDTISIATALVVLRGPFSIVHIETTGPDPDHDEIAAIHVLRIDKGVPVAEFSTRDQPLQEAVAKLLEFLGDNRQYVFTHGAAVTQAFLGRAARQSGLIIENPIGDAADLAKLAWPARNDYRLSGLAADLRLELGAMPESSAATKVILAVLLAASKRLTSKGGRVSSSIGHWGRADGCVRVRQEPW